MTDILATVDRLMNVIERQSEINEANLRALDGLNKLDDQRAAEIGDLRAAIEELHEGIAALSNRIEAVTRLHSVKA